MNSCNVFICFHIPTAFEKTTKNNISGKDEKYLLKVQFRSFKRQNIKMSHSVVQKNDLKRAFMLVFG